MREIASPLAGFRSPFGRRGAASAVWLPLALFASGEQGAWYDPSDFSTMYQDNLGVTPVTAVGQTVGRILDKSGNGNHATQPTASCRPVLARVPFGGRRNLLTYTEQFDNTIWIKASSVVAAGPTAGEWYLANDGVGTGASVSYNIDFAGDGIFTIEAKQDTVRYLRLRYLNVTNTDFVHVDLQTGEWDYAAGGAGASIELLPDGFCRISFPFRPGADNAGTISIFLSDTYANATVTPDASKRAILRKPQYERGAPATHYQKVVSTHDVTEAGVEDCYYLAFDGTDDFLVTGNIDFSATDEMTVIAGVRKRSDAAIGMIVEASANVNSNNGAFALWNGSSTSGAAAYTGATRGSITATAQTTSIYPSPTTNLLTLLADISADSIDLRVDGASAKTSTADLGTGNFGNHALYIGRRGGSSLPANMHLFSFVARGKITAGDDLTNAESHAAGKTGVTL